MTRVESRFLIAQIDSIHAHQR